jgi:hypothetical protein
MPVWTPWSTEKFLAPARNQTPADQPIARRYADCENLINTVTCISDYTLGFDWWIDLLTLIPSIRTYKQYNAIVNLHNLQFTVTLTLGSLVFTSRILVTELKQCNCE